MNRFMGMMPSSEVEIEENFRVGDDQSIVTLQAGKKGWTILFSDSSSEYQDIEDIAENNFQLAFTKLNEYFDNINQIKSKISYEI